LTEKTDERRGRKKSAESGTRHDHGVVILLELNADGSDVWSRTGVKYTSSGMFKSVLKTG